MRPTKIANWVWNNLGHCPRCTRTAFLTAIALWCVACGLAVFSASAPVVLAAAAAALATTMLWLAHLLAFTKKTSGHVASKFEDNPDLSRRSLAPTFAKILGLAAIASIVPSLASADEPCYCGDREVMRCYNCDGSRSWCPCCGDGCGCPAC
jgi:hypothetical protein